MIMDPLTVWNGPFPYEVLAPAGVTPEFTHAEMDAVSSTLMTRGLLRDPKTHKAWHELHNIQRRLLADFLLYDVDAAAEIAQARARIAEELADPKEPPEVARALRVPAELLEELADELAGELRGVALEPPGPVPELPHSEPVPPPSLINDLIQFDR